MIGRPHRWVRKRLGAGRRWFVREPLRWQLPGVLALVGSLYLLLRGSGADRTEAVIATASLVTAAVAISSLLQSSRLLAATQRTSLQTAAREVRAALPILDIRGPTVGTLNGRNVLTFTIQNRSTWPALNAVALVHGEDAGGIVFSAGTNKPLLQPGDTEEVVARYAAPPARSARLSVRCEGALGGAIMQIFEWDQETSRFERTKLDIDPAVPRTTKF